MREGKGAEAFSAYDPSRWLVVGSSSLGRSFLSRSQRPMEEAKSDEELLTTFKFTGSITGVEKASSKGFKTV